MPASTPLGINHPTGPDQYSAVVAMAALATTADQAITSSITAGEARSRNYTDTSAADLRQHVADMIAASHLGDSTPEEIEQAVANVLGSQAWRDRQAQFAHVTDYGAKGDGVTDDTDAIRAALASGKHVEFSRATYKVTGGFTVPSGTVVSGNGATLTSDTLIGALFHVAGSAEPLAVNLVGTYNATDTVLTTQVPHNLVQGEVFRVVGQRCAASIDAPPADRLGMSTGDSGVPWFGEYVKVRSVDSPTQVTTAQGLIFNGYRQDKTQETHPKARDRSTVNRMRWASGVMIQGFVIDMPTTYTVRLDYAKDCVVRDIRETRRHRQGYVVGATGCYRCLITDVHTEYPAPAPEGTDYWMRNQFKLMGCQNVVIDRCTADGGEQVVDFTYLESAMIPTIGCAVVGCEFAGYDANAVTLHPGVWGALIEGNDFRASNTSLNVSANSMAIASGIGVRAPYSVIRNNKVRGRIRKGDTGAFVSGGSYGVHLYDGGGHHVTVEGNQIIGYDFGVGISDGNEPAERHGELHTFITSNYILDCVFGVRLIRGNTADDSTQSALAISNNFISSGVNGACGVHLSNGTAAGTRAAGVIANRFHFTGTAPVPIRVGARTVDPVIVGNVVTGSASLLYETQAGASNGTIALAGNVVVSPSGVNLYPPPGTGGGGTIPVRPDPTVDGAILIGD